MSRTETLILGAIVAKLHCAATTRGEGYEKPRIAVPTITAMLLVVGLTVPFGRPSPNLNPHLTFKSINVDLTITLTQSFRSMLKAISLAVTRQEA